MAQLRAPTITAHGMTMPAIGFGTFGVGDRAAELVQEALRVGYRHIDTARKYGSEPGVGAGIKAAGLAREDVFLTTKVTEDNARESDFLKSVETSLKTLGVDYVDLLLIHWPQPKVPLAETVGALVKAKRNGWARHVGVSNFTVALVEEAVRLSPEPLAVNQIEYHPYLRQDKLLAVCARNGMILTAYCPLARGQLVDDPLLVEIGASHGKTAAQVALRWLIQHPQVAAVPRALETAHVAENLDIFDFALSEAEMARIGELRRRDIRIANPPERAPVWDAA